MTIEWNKICKTQRVKRECETKLDAKQIQN